MFNMKNFVITFGISSLIGGGVLLYSLPPNPIHKKTINTDYYYEYNDETLNNVEYTTIQNMKELSASIEASKKPKYKTQYVIITYYTASENECGKNDGVTASGTVATEGRTVAADHLPFGTVVEIDGVQYIVEDRFGGGYGNKIDIFVNDKHTAYKLGTKKVEVKIYE